MKLNPAEPIFNLKKNRQRRKDLRNHSTSAEAVLWKYLQRKQIEGKKFRRQAGIGPFFVDFYCPECRVVVELDGAPHFRVTSGEYEAERRHFLESLGIVIIRFENRVVFRNPEAVVETIRRVLQEREMGALRGH